MAEQSDQQPQQQQQQPMAAAFPAPPPFYTNFTKANLAKLRQHQRSKPSQATATDPKHDSENSILDLPPELRLLVPPPPPSDDSYRSFGSHINLRAPERTLADAGIPQLYPDSANPSNPQPHLVDLARSLLTTYLSLIHNLSQDPLNPDISTRLEEMQNMSFNMHHLINTYRPHQARESLILMMEERIASMKAEVARIRDGKGKVEELVKGIREAGGMASDQMQGRGVDVPSAEHQVEVKGELALPLDGEETQKSLWDKMDSAVTG